MPGFMGYQFLLENFKLAKFGKNLTDKSKLFFKESGVLNLIPYCLETDLIHTWAPYFKQIKMTKKLNSTRFLVNEIYAFPFPLSQRHGDMYF